MALIGDGTQMAAALRTKATFHEPVLLRLKMRAQGTSIQEFIRLGALQVAFDGSWLTVTGQGPGGGQSILLGFKYAYP
ncbi:MAG: hypothetical protein AAB303_03435, partial [Chloroflexota bacterium]